MKTTNGGHKVQHFSPTIGTHANEVEPNQLLSVAAAKDLKVVSKFWIDLTNDCSDEDVPNPDELIPQEDPDFEVVLSKSQKNKLKQKEKSPVLVEFTTPVLRVVLQPTRDKNPFLKC